MLLLAAGVFAGCAAPDPAPFLGTWQLSGSYAGTSGSGSTLRTFSHTSAAPLKGFRVEISRRSESSELLSADSEGCRLRWRLSGRTARLEPGQSCTSSRQRTTSTVALTDGSIAVTVVGPGRLSVEGTVEGTLSEGGAIAGATQPVTGHVSGTLTPVAPMIR